MDFLNDYIVLVVAGICLCVGYLIRYAINNKKLNQYIPLIVSVLGVLLNIWAKGFEINPEIIFGGLLSGLASTGMYEMLRNFIKRFSVKEK
ncbi:MAG: holin [Clostridia bacterium]|nr:holin [Clostridia bacterium]